IQKIFQTAQMNGAEAPFIETIRPLRPSGTFSQAKPQRIQLDKAFSIALIVDLIRFEGDMSEAVERLRRFAADNRCLAFKELQPHDALDMFLALVDQGLKHQPLRREPEAVVDELGIARHDLILEMRSAAIERDAFDAAMRSVQDRTARRLVDTA